MPLWNLTRHDSTPEGGVRPRPQGGISLREEDAQTVAKGLGYAIPGVYEVQRADLPTARCVVRVSKSGRIALASDKDCQNAGIAPNAPAPNAAPAPSADE